MRRESPTLYRSEFIDRDGHIGYQPPGDNLKIFEDAQFRVIEQLGLERTPLQSTTVYQKMRKWPGPYAVAGNVLHRIENSRPGFFAYLGVLRLLDETIGRFMPPRWSRMALTVCERA
jgi:hypothetical protein